MCSRDGWGNAELLWMSLVLLEAVSLFVCFAHVAAEHYGRWLVGIHPNWHRCIRGGTVDTGMKAYFEMGKGGSSKPEGRIFSSSLRIVVG